MNNLDFSYGLIFGFALGVNYLNFEGEDEGTYCHIAQFMLGVVMIEFSWIS